MHLTCTENVFVFTCLLRKATVKAVYLICKNKVPSMYDKAHHISRLQDLEESF